MIVFVVIALLILAAGVFAYFDGLKDYREYGEFWDTPTLIGDNPLFWFWDKFYAAGWYAAARKEE